MFRTAIHITMSYHEDCGRRTCPLHPTKAISCRIKHDNRKVYAIQNDGYGTWFPKKSALQNAYVGKNSATKGRIKRGACNVKLDRHNMMHCRKSALVVQAKTTLTTRRACDDGYLLRYERVAKHTHRPGSKACCANVKSLVTCSKRPQTPGPIHINTPLQKKSAKRRPTASAVHMLCHNLIGALNTIHYNTIPVRRAP